MLRIGTFNVENLFARYRFRENFSPTLDGFTINDLAFDIYDETAKQITAKAIKEVDADILALQEVESLSVLDRFNSKYLGGMKYQHRMVIDAFDPRMIDIAVLSRYLITSVRSYRQERNKANTGWLFSRDCLEVDIAVNGKVLTVYINHLKSMIGGRAETRARRVEQAKRVAEIVNHRWAGSQYAGNYVVLGDFNDYLDEDTALTPLINHPGLRHVSERIEAQERWTHYWAGGDEYRQLDYLLLSPPLADDNPAAPEIMRKGLPFRAERYEGDRFDFIGEDNPKASDHCPLYMNLDLV
jgi:predicted extracellular nuclease